MAKEFSYEINEEFGTNIIGEGGSTFSALRKISWNGRDEKIDIRKYTINSDGNEVMGKGISLSEEEADTLTNLLIENGYGDAYTILNSVKNNDEYIGHMATILKDIDDERVNKSIEMVREYYEEDNLYDPKELFESDDEVKDDE